MACSSLPLVSHAQPATSITGTSGHGSLGTIVTPSGSTYTITGGERPGGGTNLFHSFQNFSVGVGDTAVFTNTPVSGTLPLTENILGRVTSNNPSHIFGTIQTTGFGSANLFLMNPAGIVFGPTASLNVGGSVTFTTADYLRLSDNGRFNATPNTTTDAMLSTAPVAAYGFLRPNPGALSIHGSQFSVPEGAGISLIGGNITVERGIPTNGRPLPAKLSAPGGQINITSLASTGEVSAIDFKANPGTTMGQLTLTQGSVINVSDNAAGTIRIRSGQLILADATISSDTRDIDGAQTAVDIIATDKLLISDTRGVPTITARTSGSGKAGEVLIASVDLEATSSVPSLFSPLDTHFALIDTHTTGIGQAGPIHIRATGNLNVSGQPTGPMFFLDSGMLGTDSGNGGDVTVSARNVHLQHTRINTGDLVARLLSEESGGSGGNLTITTDTINISRTTLATDAFSLGHAGNLTLSGHDIQIANFSQLSLLGLEGGAQLTIDATKLTADSSQFELEMATGRGGGANVTAHEVTLLNGTTIRSQTVGDGDAGDIRITATHQLTLGDRFSSLSNDETTLGARTRPTGLFTNSLGDADLGTHGHAGSIFINTPQLQLYGGARINSTTQSNGHAGNVTITATSQITMSGERPTPVIEEELFGLGSTRASGIYSRTVGNEFCSSTTCGNAGHVSITTGLLNLTNGAIVNTGTASTGNGGNVVIHASEAVSIAETMDNGTKGGVFSQAVGSASGSGGNISLTAGQSVSIRNGGSVSASSTGPGAAGNIEINAGKQFDVERGSVTTQSNQLNGGNITILASDLVRVIDGTISTSALNGSGNGGNITIDPKVVLLQSSEILAQAKDGNGGSISIITPLYLKDQASLVSADSQFGVNGTVTIQSPISNLSGTVGQLVSKTSPPQVLLQNRCVALAGGEQSTFLLTGRETLPAEPSGWLSSPVSMEHWTGEEAAHASRRMVRNRELNALPVMTAQTSRPPVLSLRRLTPPGFLVRTFAAGATGCPS